MIFRVAIISACIIQELRIRGLERKAKQIKREQKEETIDEVATELTARLEKLTANSQLFS